MRESKSGITRDSPPPIQYFRDTVGWDIETPREFGSTHTQLLQFLGQVLTRMNYLNCHKLS
jgi:hypothetical protein